MSLFPFDTAKLGTNQISSKLFHQTVWMAKMLTVWQLQYTIQSLWMILPHLWITCDSSLDFSPSKPSEPYPIFGYCYPKGTKKVDGPSRNPSTKKHSKSSREVAILLKTSIFYAISAKRRSNDAASSSSLICCSRRSLRT